MSAAGGEGVLELVVYKLKDGATRDQFLGTVDAVSAWVRKQPGFISHDRSYAASEDKWIDILYWRSMTDALAAAEAAEASADCAPMFGLIDMDNEYVYLHGEPAPSSLRA